MALVTSQVPNNRYRIVNLVDQGGMGRFSKVETQNFASLPYFASV
jgi:hypothetical protein